MSRKRTSSVHQAFAQVKLFCPAGHLVASAMRQQWQDGPGEQYLVDPDGRTARNLGLGGKVKLTCRQCRQSGRHLDLQASAAKLSELLDTRGKHTLNVGG